MSFEQQQQQQQQQQQHGGVDDLANRLNEMQVYSQVDHSNVNNNNNQQQQQQRRNPLAGSDLTNIQPQIVDSGCNQQEDDGDADMDIGGDLYQAQENQQEQLDMEQQQANRNQNKSGNILIATNVDSSVFSDFTTQSQFESLFLAYDNQVTFRYLRSFRRVRLDFIDAQHAELARQNLGSFKIGDTICRCYIAQMIRPQHLQQDSNNSNSNNSTNYGNNLNECYLSSQTNHLNIPKLTKQFLISPPASPPVGWEPVNEGSPCIDVQLLSAMANLVPGKVHEIHQGTESQPGIYVEVCEDPQFPQQQQQQQQMPNVAKRHIPKTPLPLKPSAF